LITVTDKDTVRAFSPIAIGLSRAKFNANDGKGVEGKAYGPVSSQPLAEQVR